MRVASQQQLPHKQSCLTTMHQIIKQWIPVWAACSDMTVAKDNIDGPFWLLLKVASVCMKLSFLYCSVLAKFSCLLVKLQGSSHWLGHAVSKQWHHVHKRECLQCNFQQCRSGWWWAACEWWCYCTVLTHSTFASNSARKLGGAVVYLQ